LLKFSLNENSIHLEKCITTHNELVYQTVVHPSEYHWN